MDGSADRHRVGGRPEGLVTGDLLVVGVILVGSFTGGPSRHIQAGEARSLELRASGPKEMTDNCFELCLQLTQILFHFHHHHSCPGPAGPFARGPPPDGRTRLAGPTYKIRIPTHTRTGPLHTYSTHTHDTRTYTQTHSIRFACPYAHMLSCHACLAGFVCRHLRTTWQVACDKPSWCPMLR